MENKKNSTHAQDLSMEMHSYERREHLHTLEDRKAEAFISAVDVVVHLHDPSRSSTKRTAPPCSAHVLLDDVLALLIQQEG